MFNNYNSSDYDELMKFFKSTEISNNIIFHRKHKGLFLRKQSICKIVGKSIYDKIKSQIVISLPSSLLNIIDDNDFLDNLAKYNDDDINQDILKIKLRIEREKPQIGYNYILQWSGDKYKKWYKIGETSREPEIRASEWNYELKDYRISSSRKLTEKILHKYLNFAHCIRPKIHGTGATEIEWFYISHDLLMRTMNAVINTCDPLHNEFNSFNVTRSNDLTEKNILNLYRKALNVNSDEKIIYEDKFNNLPKLKDNILKFIEKNVGCVSDVLDIPNRTVISASIHSKNNVSSSRSSISEMSKLKLNKEEKEKINSIIQQYYPSNYFHVTPRRYLFDTLHRLFNNDREYMLTTKSLQDEAILIINENNSSKYFKVEPRRKLFKIIQYYF